MAQPTYAQLINLTSTPYGASLPPQTVRERILACMAMIASQQNPDGTVL